MIDISEVATTGRLFFDLNICKLMRVSGKKKTNQPENEEVPLGRVLSWMHVRHFGYVFFLVLL